MKRNKANNGQKRQLRKRIKAFIVATMCLPFACFVSACESNVLKVATSADFPPFEYFEGTNIVGWDIDIIKAVADELGMRVQIDNMDFDSVIASVQSGAYHIGAAGLSATEERKQSVSFTQDIFDSSQVIIKRTGDTSINSPFDLAGKKVGAQSGTIGFFLASMDEDYAFDNDEAILGEPQSVSSYSSGALAVLDLLNGTIDAIIIDKYPAEKFVEANSGIEIATDAEGDIASVYLDAYAFALNKNDTELLEKVNDAIDKLREDGTFAKITSKYFGSND